MSLNKIKELFKINNFDYFNLKSSESTMIDAKNHIEKGFKNFVITVFDPGKSCGRSVSNSLNNLCW